MANNNADLSQKTTLSLVRFATVPSATTQDVTLELAPNTSWHFSRRKDGLYIHEPTKKGKRNEPLLLSTFLDLDLSEGATLRLAVQDSSCTFGHLYSSFLAYRSSLDQPYVTIGHASNFLGPQLHYFRFGESLEFLLDIPSLQR